MIALYGLIGNIRHFSVDERKGKKCHEVLCGNHSSCAMCNNEQLLEREFEKRIT